MGFFEDLIASLQGFNRIEVDPLEQYSGPNITDTRAGLYRDAVERMGGEEALMGDAPEEEGSWFSRTPLGQDLAKYKSEGKIQLPFEPGPAIAGIAEKRVTPGDEAAEFAASRGVDPMRAKALEAISSRESEQEQVAKEASKEAAKQRLLEAAGIQNQQREFMQGTVPLVEDYDKKIAIGGMPGRGGRDEILARIRAQALAKGGGTMGAGGGTFSEAPDSPQIRQRIAERDAWAADQPMRDLEFALTPEQMRMRPQGAVAAAELLPQMRQQKTLDKQQALQEKLVSKLADGSGKIPFEQAMQLEAAGLNVPYGARGMSPEQFDSKINDIIQGASVDLSRAIEAQTMGAPPEAVSAIAGFSKFIEQRARQLKALVDQGQMSRDEADALLQQIIMTEAQSTNAIKAAQLLGFGQQQQPAGE